MNDISHFFLFILKSPQTLAAIAIAINVVYILGILIYRRQSVILAGVPIFLVLMCLGMTLHFFKFHDELNLNILEF